MMVLPPAQIARAVAATAIDETTQLLMTILFILVPGKHSRCRPVQFCNLAFNEARHVFGGMIEILRFKVKQWHEAVYGIFALTDS